MLKGPLGTGLFLTCRFKSARHFKHKVFLERKCSVLYLKCLSTLCIRRSDLIVVDELWWSRISKLKREMCQTKWKRVRDVSKVNCIRCALLSHPSPVRLEWRRHHFYGTSCAGERACMEPASSALGPASRKSNLTWQAHVTLVVPICPESRRWQNPARTRSWTRTDWITLHACEEHETSPPHNSRTVLRPARLRGLFINRKVWVTFPPSRSMRIFMRVVLLTTEAVSFYESRALLGQNRFWSCDPFVNTCIRAIYDTDKYIFYFRVP